MKQRGDGSVYYSKSRQQWVAQLDIGGDGPRAYARKFRTSEKAAFAALRELKLAANSQQDAQGPLLEDWIALWLASRHVTQLAPATREQYAQVARDRIAPPLGHYRLKQLTATRLDRWLTTLSESHTRRTVVGARNVLRICLNHAVATDLLESNKLDKLKLAGGKNRQRKIHVITPAQMHTLLLQCSPWLRACLSIILLLGLRRGEALGLQWDDLDWLAGKVSIVRAVVAKVDRKGQKPGPGVRPPKTDAGTRTIPLPAIALEILFGQRRRAELQASVTKQPVPIWVFPARTGRFLQPRNLNRELEVARDKAGIPTARLHVLRHTAATALLSLGTDDNAVAEWLGHTDVRTTRSLYHHPDVKLQQDGATALTKHWRGVLD